MKSSHITSIFTYLSLNQFYRLLLCITTPLLINYPHIVAFAVPKNITQVPIEGMINRPTLKLGSQGNSVTELQAALKILGFYTGVVDGVYREGTAIAVSRFKQSAGLSPDGVVDNATWQKLFPSVVSSSISQSPNSDSGPVPTTPHKRTKIKRKTQLTPNTSSKNTTRQHLPTKQTQKSQMLIQPTPPDQQVPGIQYTQAGWPILRGGMHGVEVAKLQKLLHKLGFLTGGVDGDFGLTTVTAVKAAQTRYGLQPDGVVGGATWETFLRQLHPHR